MAQFTVGMELASIRLGERNHARQQPDGGKLHPYYNIQVVFSAKGMGRRSVRGIAE
jgi:hypothetical protein